MFKNSFLYISTYVIPLLMLLYIQFNNIRNLIILHMLPISIIGIIEVLLQKRTPIEKILIIIGHLLFFVLVIFYKPNNYKLHPLIFPLTLCIPISIIINMSIWKYEITKEHMVILYTIIYICFLSIQDVFID